MEDFEVKREHLMGIFEMGYEHPSPIQEGSILAFLKGRDRLARAKSGTDTGKTGPFIIPMDPKRETNQGLLLTPTQGEKLSFKQDP